MKENDLYFIKEYNFDNLLVTELGSLIENWFRVCPNNYFHKFKYDCIYENELTNINYMEKLI